jgi:hypothetical protein
VIRGPLAAAGAADVDDGLVQPTCHPALSISLIFLLITGLDVSATVQVAYAWAFTMTRCAASRSTCAAPRG